MILYAALLAWLGSGLWLLIAYLAGWEPPPERELHRSPDAFEPHTHRWVCARDIRRDIRRRPASKDELIRIDTRKHILN